ncbi:MAG TPA: hypothetical protein VFB12_07545 [Ktedonobacteraceae bacterium]|nr:hypothetical protein [Ktedonobacteraceae bacterium]
MLLLLLLLAGPVSLAACSPGHLGSNVIAFIRDGQLWTIDPNGANAFEVVAQGPPVVGYSWSPTHQLLTFRALDADFAKTPAASHLNSQPVTGQIGDVASTANTIGVDGGTPITIAFSSPSVYYSNPIWNSTGNRLLYRETPRSPLANPASITWWISQNDQPGGIAIKSLPGSYSIPSLSYISQYYMAIGNSSKGVFTTTLAGTNLRYLVHDPLPGHPLPATLERILWQPAHQDTSFLYAVPATAHDSTNISSHTVQLLLGTLDGHITTLATCACTQFAWSPDGNYILYSTGSTYTLLNPRDKTSFSLTEENSSVPYWSPDSHFLLLDGFHTLVLVNVAAKQQKVLLSNDNTTVSKPAPTTLPAVNALLQPVPNSLWAADSRHFLFLTRDRLSWQGQRLRNGKALYTVAIDSSGRPQGTPAIADTGNDTQVGWTYEDANTSFLY